MHCRYREGGGGGGGKITENDTLEQWKITDFVTAFGLIIELFKPTQVHYYTMRVITLHSKTILGITLCCQFGANCIV